MSDINDSLKEKIKAVLQKINANASQELRPDKSNDLRTETLLNDILHVLSKPKVGDLDKSAITVGLNKLLDELRKISTVQNASLTSPRIIRGGGSAKQFVSGETSTKPTGVVAMGKDGSDVISALQLDSSKNLKVVDQSGFVSTDNSTTSTLAADAVFTGTGEDVTRFNSVTVTSTSNVANATSGISLEFSPDGTNWDRKLIGHIVGKKEHTHTLRIQNKFFRVVYTNGSTIQTSFRLQTLYHTSNSLPYINRTGQPQGTVDTLPVRQTTEVDLDYARKHMPGGRAFFFFGFNDSMTSGTWEDVWPNASDVPWLTTAAKMEVVSSNAADASAGTGVRQVELHGLSTTGVNQDEIITMNGTTAVESSLTYIRVNKLHNENVGTYGGSHEGDITCRVTGAGSTQSLMTGREGSVDVSSQYGSGEAGNGYWSVPLDKVLYITRLEVTPNVKANQTIDIVLYEREGILNTSAPQDPRRIIWSAIEIDKPVEKVFKSHIKIKNLTDLWFRAKPSGTNSKVSVSLDFYLVDEDASGA